MERRTREEEHHGNDSAQLTGKFWETCESGQLHEAGNNMPLPFSPLEQMDVSSDESVSTHVSRPNSPTVSFVSLAPLSDCDFCEQEGESGW